MIQFLLGGFSFLAAAALFEYIWAKEGPTVEADLLADEVALKEYLTNLEADLQAKYAAIASEVVTEMDALKVKSLTAAAAGLTEVLTVIQTELSKLS